MWVVASKDFTYNGHDVKAGEAFELQQCRNDGLLLKHRLVLALDPQPDAEALKHLPQCGTCGRRFVQMHHREVCGRSHELSAAEQRAQRREAAAQRRNTLREAGVAFN